MTNPENTAPAAKPAPAAIPKVFPSIFTSVLVTPEAVSSATKAIATSVVAPIEPPTTNSDRTFGDVNGVTRALTLVGTTLLAKLPTATRTFASPSMSLPINAPSPGIHIVAKENTIVIMLMSSALMACLIISRT
ncbi:hypothetical protein [Micromonospora rubida]|uniref:hypothetical protein n=1 Tax=Micromonospora rubida TaxID=2697657 RepID=UPI0013766694|nr:hypothetical protein [Micromonospora rubida]NBE80095.1 hypothetical protein [Micromonospora rubida]